MPIIFNTNADGVATSPVDADAEEVQVVEVNWDADVVAEHPEADLNALVPIPPAGLYLFKVRLQDRGEDKENPYGSVTKPKGGAAGKPFINAMIELELVDESSLFHGFKINDRVSSLVFDKRGTSPLHHIMNCLGVTLPSVIKLKDLRDKVVETLESAPMLQAELEWRAARKNGPGQYDWEDVARKMRDFPKDPEGDGRSQIYVYTNPKTHQKSEHRAVPYIAKYLLQGQ